MSFKVGNQNSFYFEAATLEDIETIFELNKMHVNTYEDLSQINYDWVLNWVHLKIEQHVDAYQVIVLNGKKVGYFYLHEEGGEFELDDLYILKGYQGRGIGSEVLRHCIQIATEQHKGLFLYVFTQNVRAIKLYESFGFRVVQEVNKTRYIMRRN